MKVVRDPHRLLGHASLPDKLARAELSAGEWMRGSVRRVIATAPE
jgi:hypothetical protein